jgi:arylsulfatase A
LNFLFIFFYFFYLFFCLCELMSSFLLFLYSFFLFVYFEVVSLQIPSNTPNFVIFFADDVGYGDFGFTGHPTILTPNIDYLAAQGTRFTQLYTSAPVCSPSRAGLLTGRLPIRSGIYTSHNSYPYDQFRVFYPFSTGSLPPSEITLPQLLKEHGYSTAMMGKWHLGHYNNSLPLHRGFDEWFGIPYSHDEGCPPGYQMPCETSQHIYTPTPLYDGDTIIQQPVNLDTLIQRMTDRAISFINESSLDGKPFFLYVAYPEAHVPLFASSAFLGQSLRGLYGDAMSEMDNSVGTIYSYLVQSGLLSSTYVFFSSDNGPWTSMGIDGGSAGLFRGQKGETWEGGMRVPGILVGPSVSPFGIVTDIASQMDVFVTFLDLAGISLPTDRPIDGVSWTNVLFQSGRIPRHCYFLYRDSLLMAARCGAYKAHYITQCGYCENPPVSHSPPILYNIQVDPSESFPLNTTEPQYQTILHIIDEAVHEHQSGMEAGISQLDSYDLKVEPCCDLADRCVCGPW